jgi:hypothetical protein
MSDKSKVVVDLNVDPNVDPNTDKGDTIEYLVDLGVEMIWKNCSTHCPHFEIIFEGSSPAKPGDKLTGTLEQPVSLRMPKEKAKFFYKVHFQKKDGTRCIDTHTYSIRICPNGRPC